MYNELDETRVYFNPGDIVTVRHDVENKPQMWVIEKSVRSMYNKETNEKGSYDIDKKCYQRELYFKW